MLPRLALSLLLLLLASAVAQNGPALLLPRFSLTRPNLTRPRLR